MACNNIDFILSIMYLRICEKWKKQKPIQCSSNVILSWNKIAWYMKLYTQFERARKSLFYSEASVNKVCVRWQLLLWIHRQFVRLASHSVDWKQNWKMTRKWTEINAKKLHAKWTRNDLDAAFFYLSILFGWQIERKL